MSLLMKCISVKCIYDLKIGKAKLEKVRKNKRLPLHSPDMGLNFPSHTQLAFHFLGTLMNDERRLQARPWGVPHQWGWGP